MAEYIERSKALSAVIYSLSETTRRIEAIPSVDVLPVVYGKWIRVISLSDPSRESWKCSHCSVKANARYNFCPNCGAKMDKNNEK